MKSILFIITFCISNTLFSQNLNSIFDLIFQDLNQKSISYFDNINSEFIFKKAPYSDPSYLDTLTYPYFYWETELRTDTIIKEISWNKKGKMDTIIIDTASPWIEKYIVFKRNYFNQLVDYLIKNGSKNPDSKILNIVSIDQINSSIFIELHFESSICMGSILIYKIENGNIEFIEFKKDAIYDYGAGCS